MANPSVCKKGGYEDAGWFCLALAKSKSRERSFTIRSESPLTLVRNKQALHWAQVLRLIAPRFGEQPAGGHWRNGRRRAILAARKYRPR